MRVLHLQAQSDPCVRKLIDSETVREVPIIARVWGKWLKGGLVSIKSPLKMDESSKLLKQLPAPPQIPS